MTPSFETIFVIFQGGGAKGITHVGALQALEDEHLVPVGVAGTSAGAIIAALVAVGYRANDLLDPNEETTILGKLSPIRWLGRGRWLWFRMFRVSVLPLLWLGGGCFVAAAIGMIFGSADARTSAAAWWAMAITAGAALALLAMLAPLFLSGGFFPSELLRNLINDKLRSKLKDHYRAVGVNRDPPAWVTFADIDPVNVPYCRFLKIVASDVRGQQLVPFDSATPCAVVADAVVASASIPLAFAPPSVRGWVRSAEQVFADGGLVSNLPSWVFTVEKRALERQQQGSPFSIIAFTLKPAADPRVPGKRSSLIEYLGDVLETGIFGGQAIIEQFVEGLALIKVRTPLSTLAFDCGWKKAVDAYEMGRSDTKRALLSRRLRRVSIDRVLNQILASLRMDVEKARRDAGKPVPRLRLALIDPVGPADREASEFRVVASAGMDDDADDQLPLDPRNTAAPKAFRDRWPAFATVQGRSPRELWMTRYERALVWPELNSIIAVPVFGRQVPPGQSPPPAQRVLCLDSSDDLQGEFTNSMFMGKMVGTAILTSATLITESINKEIEDGQPGSV